MLLVIIALLWVALLAPVVVRRLRDGHTERSIESFHDEHEVLSRQNFAVSPAYRLNESEEDSIDDEPRASRLTVVHDDDTYRSLESRRSWDEWSDDYDYERHDPAARPEPVNRYASAYAATPRDADLNDHYEPPVRRRTMQAQRRLMVITLLAAVVVATSSAVMLGSSLLVDAAILTWFALAAYGALALFAISQGLLDESSLWIGRSRWRSALSIEPAYEDQDEDDYDDGFGASVAGLRDDRYYEPASEGWRRESSRFALG
jgi:hypothetical protein